MRTSVACGPPFVDRSVGEWGRVRNAGPATGRHRACAPLSSARPV